MALKQITTDISQDLTNHKKERKKFCSFIFGKEVSSNLQIFSTVWISVSAALGSLSSSSIDLIQFSICSYDGDLLVDWRFVKEHAIRPLHTYGHAFQWTGVAGSNCLSMSEDGHTMSVVGRCPHPCGKFRPQAVHKGQTMLGAAHQDYSRLLERRF